ncbi:Highly reducing polyketide synthase alt5 [Colletotrichum spinosum]|uniref:Highly reducing polyketide synthase alt5 n=1 Tax=Colletotrichum spinosum TaxID=1347390 RepID=A0A4R8PY21_9PEZI|nr:Highly reducing polyketide synthase alt5 [Colletotrichum spinosum]
MEADKIEPIAVVGINLKFPGDALTPESFWEMLRDGRSAAGRVPADRFNIDAFHHPDPNRMDSIRFKEAHFMREDPREFDAPFFSMSPAEASILDAQQRGLLEGAYRVFENAGMPMSRLARSNTSVYAATCGRDFDAIFFRDPEFQSRYQATASGYSLLSNRISHFFDLRGPSLTVDTACSSGLYAFHLACQSLLSDDADMSLVCGSNTYLTPETMSIPLSNAGFLSADGRSYSFGSRANGYARGEGFGFVLLKKLSRALEDGHVIRAVVRATGANQDGRTPSITQPSPTAQVQLIRKTYERGGLDFATTGYVEAHGTGTIVGDPIEASAIGHVFRRHREESRPLYVGSVKSNIGHLEGASGLAGILKAIVVLEQGVIPPNIWVQEVNPAIDTKDLRIEFPTKATLWPTEGLRRASVSSFGYGGANAHVVIDDACNYLRLRGVKGLHKTVDFAERSRDGYGHENSSVISNRGPNGHSNGLENGDSHAFEEDEFKGLLVLSAADEDGPRRLAAAFESHLQDLPRAQRNPAYLNDLLHTLSVRRTHLPFRTFSVASSLAQSPAAWSSGLVDRVRSAKAADLKFVFTGQGAQWARMGLGLVQYPVFSKSLSDCNLYLQSLGCEWSVWDELHASADTTRLSTPALAQPLCTSVQVALVELLWSWGIRPSSVCGHSSGEIAAAFCARALTRESAWKIAYFRGLVATKALEMTSSEPTTMMSVGLGEKHVIPYLSGDGSVAVGCVNSPVNVTLTGSRRQIDSLWEVFDEKKVFARKLAVDVAYHSKFMNPVASEYAELIKDIRGPSTPSLKDDGHSTGAEVFSSVTGSAITLPELREPSYWVKNLTSPVRFSEALTTMVAGGDTKTRTSSQTLHVLVEVGPQAALRRPAEDTLSSILRKDQWIFSPALKANRNDAESLLETVGLLWTCGLDVHLGAVNSASVHVKEKPKMLPDLPQYPFSRAKKYWTESRLSRNYSFRPHRRHQLLGLRSRDWNSSEASWRHFIKAKENPWIVDHALNGSPIYPGSGMIVMAIEAARQLSADLGHQPSGYRLKNVRFLRAVNVNESEHGVEAQIHMRPRRSVTHNSGRSWYDWRVFSTTTGDEWTECAHGSIRVETEPQETPRSAARRLARNASLRGSYQAAVDECEHSVHRDQFYDNLRRCGFEYGPFFRQLRGVSYSRNGRAAATLPLRGYADRMPHAAEDPCVIHPTTLDNLVQLQIVALSLGGWNKVPTMMFSHVREMWLSQKLLTAPGNPVLAASSHETFRGFREAEYSTVALLADTQEPVFAVEGERGTAITSLSLADVDAGTDRLCYRMDLQPALSLLTGPEAAELLEKRFVDFEPPSAETVDRGDAIALHYIERAVRQLETTEVRFDEGRKHLQRYVRWMSRVCNDRSKYSLESRGRSRLRIEDVLSEADLEPSQRLVSKVGENLRSILTGRSDALQTIFEGKLADGFYHSAMFTVSYQKIGAYMSLLAHQNPNLRVLEVGAGTGSSTAHILSALTQHQGNSQSSVRFAEYAYTDISPGFFEHAKERFQQHAGRMRFQKLDVEADPAEQGFEAGSYDVIVAGNVLHATSDMHRTLKHVRKLLKPGGKLLMAEITNVNNIRDAFVFGLLPGWWLRPAPPVSTTGGDGHADQGPLLTESQWADLLPQCGFTGLDMAFRDHPEQPHHRLSVLVATAEEETPVKASAPQSIYIVSNHGAPTETTTALREQLSNRHSDSKVLTVSLDEAKELDLASTPATVVSLLELDEPILDRVDDAQLEGIKKMSLCARHLLWVTGNGDSPDCQTSVGLGRTICSERDDQSFVTLNLEPGQPTSARVAAISRVLGHVLEPNPWWSETEFVERDGIVHIPRIVPNQHLNDTVHSRTARPDFDTFTVGQTLKPHFNITIGTPGLLDTLFYAEAADPAASLKDGDVEIEIKASSLNFKDVMIALGQIPGNGFGFDGAGIVSRTARGSSFSAGDRVMFCSADGGAFGTYVRCSELQAQKIPDGMPYATAASLPAVYTTAVYSLIHTARLERGESVLIHAGAGGVGQSAIQVAKLVGADIFVTVGSEAKRDLVRDLYGIPDGRIFSSRDASFETDVKLATNGRGVDVILNSLGGELLQHTWECIAPCGRFVDIGKADIINNSVLPMGPFNKNVTFSAVDEAVLHDEAKPVFKKVMVHVMDLFAKHPQLHEPKPLHVFPASKLEDAMRFLQGGKNTGKAIIDFETPGDEVQYLPVLRPTYSFEAGATYVISGGLGGLGRRIVRWMVERGARHFLLLSRRGAAGNPKAAKFIQEMESLGAVISAPACDPSKREVLESVLGATRSDLPPIKGCIQAAMVLQDHLFENMTSEAFHGALAPKTAGSHNLHDLLPDDLDFFVLLSSFSGISGSRGQSNYAAGNTYQDGLAHYRAARGLKAVSINLPLIAEDGWAAENYDIVRSMYQAGHSAVTQDQLAALLDAVCDPGYDCSKPGAAQLVVVSDSPQGMWRMTQSGAIAWGGKPLFNNIMRIGKSSDGAGGGGLDGGSAAAAQVDYLALAKAAGSVEEAGEVIAQGLLQKLASSLSVPAENLDVRRPAYVLGVDSLIAVEVRYWFMKNLGTEVAVFNILKDQSLTQLCQSVAAQVLQVGS